MHGRPSRGLKSSNSLERQYPQDIQASSLGGYFFAFFPPQKEGGEAWKP